jgi:hypothetical protein
MLSEAVFRKSPQGVQTIASRERRIAPRLRSLLILVDGKRPYAELARLGAALGEPEALMGQLVDAGLVEAVEPPQPEPAPPPAAVAAPATAVAALSVAHHGEPPPGTDPLPDPAHEFAVPAEAAPDPMSVDSTLDGSVPSTQAMEYADDSLLVVPEPPMEASTAAQERIEPVWVDPPDEPEELPEIAAWTAPEPDAALVPDPPPPAPVAAPKPRARPKRRWRSHQNVPITREALIAVMSLPVSAPAPLSPERPRWPMTPQELDDARDYALRELHNLLGSDAEILAQPIAIAVTAEEMIAAIQRTKVFLRSLRGEALAAQFASMVRANTALP